MIKQDKLLAEMRKEIDAFKKINAENREINELLVEQILEYNQIIKSFQKSCPAGFFT